MSPSKDQCRPTATAKSFPRHVDAGVAVPEMAEVSVAVRVHEAVTSEARTLPASTSATHLPGSTTPASTAP